MRAQLPSSGTIKCGPSNAYLRLLRGELSSARYAAIVRRAVQIGRFQAAS